jgi:polyhydroxyalkanoate synthesis regulator phasin
MTLILSIYHIIGIMVSLTILFTVFYKQLQKNLSISWKKDIEGGLKSYKEDNDLELKWRKDIYKALDEFEKSIENKIEKQIGTKFELITKDMKMLTGGMDDLKEILQKQQETLLAIQLNVGSIKPKIESLEKRVDKIENKLESK